MTAEIEVGKALQRLGKRMVDEGQATAQTFHDWKQRPQPQADSTRGGGNGGVHFDEIDRASDRQAARMSHDWLQTLAKLLSESNHADWLMDQARGSRDVLSRKDWTPAQAEAEGWCVSHWRIRELVPIGLRPTGEPFYTGRCRRCGAWPGGDPPLEVLQTWRDGKTLRVKAS